MVQSGLTALPWFTSLPVGRAWAFLKWLVLAAIVWCTEHYFAREVQPFGVLHNTASVKEWRRQLEIDRERMAELRAVWDPIVKRAGA